MRNEINKYIVEDSEICGGTATFKGTRIMVYLVLEMLEQECKIEEIIDAYPSLSKEHIKSALRFAAWKLGGDLY